MLETYQRRPRRASLSKERQTVMLPGLHPRSRPGCFLACTPSPMDHVCSKNHTPEGFIPFGLRLIFLFFETLKEAKKQQYGLGLWLVG